MKTTNQRLFKTEAQRIADRKDEIRANSLAIGFTIFILVCLIISMIQKY